MHIIEDTAQKAQKHNDKHSQFQQLGVQIIRNKLPFGDYCLPPKISIDTKANMEEIANNIGSDHVRFKNECIRAKEAGCKLIILVENTEGITTIEDVHKWVNPSSVYRTTAITGSRLEKAMRTMSERYGVIFLFCHPSETAAKIIELLGDTNEK